MARRTAYINAFQADDIVAVLADRPIRLTPTGTAGVVYQGMVYPLCPGNFITLDDEPFDKSECPDFVANGRRIPYAELTATHGSDEQLDIDAWYLESNRFGHYLVFDSSHAAAERLVAALTAFGIGVQRWDESTR